VDVGHGIVDEVLAPDPWDSWLSQVPLTPSSLPSGQGLSSTTALLFCGKE